MICDYSKYKALIQSYAQILSFDNKIKFNNFILTTYPDYSDMILPKQYRNISYDINFISKELSMRNYILMKKNNRDLKIDHELIKFSKQTLLTQTKCL